MGLKTGAGEMGELKKQSGKRGQRKVGHFLWYKSPRKRSWFLRLRENVLR